jgi:outer membrane protein TolC
MAKPPQELNSIINSPGVIPVPPSEIVVGIPAELLRRRPDVQQAERVAAMQSAARIGIAEAEFYPHIALTGTIGVQAQNFSHLFDSQSLVGQIGPGFNWNLLNYGRIGNNVQSQDAQFRPSIPGPVNFLS